MIGGPAVPDSGTTSVGRVIWAVNCFDFSQPLAPSQPHAICYCALEASEHGIYEVLAAKDFMEKRETQLQSFLPHGCGALVAAHEDCQQQASFEMGHTVVAPAQAMVSWMAAHCRRRRSPSLCVSGAQRGISRCRRLSSWSWHQRSWARL